MKMEQLLKIIEEEIEIVLSERCQKGYKTHPTRKTKKMYGKTYRNCVKADEGVKSKADRYDPRNYVGRDTGRRFSASSGGKLPPKGLYGEDIEVDESKDAKTGTGKKPKGSGRSLYTDENPNDTVKVKFSTVADIRDTLSKSSFKSKPHKRQSQIINLIHQRVRVAKDRAKDPQKKKNLNAAFKFITKKKEASKEKTKRMKKND